MKKKWAIPFKIFCVILFVKIFTLNCETKYLLANAVVLKDERSENLTDRQLTDGR
jgi:hypothetical protein